MFVLYVVQEKRLSLGPRSWLAVDAGVPPTLFLTTLLLGGVEKLLVDAAVIKLPCSSNAGMGSACLIVGVIGLGYEYGLFGLVGEATVLEGEFFPTFSGTMG